MSVASDLFLSFLSCHIFLHSKFSFRIFSIPFKLSCNNDIFQPCYVRFCQTCYDFKSCRMIAALLKQNIWVSLRAKSASVAPVPCLVSTLNKKSYHTVHKRKYFQLTPAYCLLTRKTRRNNMVITFISVQPVNKGTFIEIHKSIHNLKGDAC